MFLVIRYYHWTSPLKRPRQSRRSRRSRQTTGRLYSCIYRGSITFAVYSFNSSTNRKIDGNVLTTTTLTIFTISSIPSRARRGNGSNSRLLLLLLPLLPILLPLPSLFLQSPQRPPHSSS